MQSILSIQSYVAYGYVGNRAAVFPLQRLGFDVTAINTVQFSNHTGYGEWEGDIFTPAQLTKIIDGIRKRGVLPQINGLLSGYMGDASLGEIMVDLAHELKSLNPNMIYCCDPVIGDVGRGIFVRPGVGEFFKHKLVEVADILTPNQFELNYLTDMPVNTLAEARAACEALLARGPKTILVTSLMVEETPENSIQMLLHSRDKNTSSLRGAAPRSNLPEIASSATHSRNDETSQSIVVTTPRFDMHPMPNGAGDLTAALCLGYTLKGLAPQTLLDTLAQSVYGIFEATFNAGSRELQLIAAQHTLIQK